MAAPAPQSMDAGWASTDSAGAALSIRGVTVRYPGAARPAVSGASLDVRPGECVALMGASGSGKTSLLKAAVGLITPSEGTVRLLGAAPGSPSIRGKTGYIPQQLGLVRSRTALANALMGALHRTPPLASAVGGFAPADRAAALEALASVGLAGKAGEKVAHLSGGERQRVAIARTLVQRPSVLLADEFVSNLDAQTADEVLDLVTHLRTAGVAIVMAMHDLDLVVAHADRVVLLAGGTVRGTLATKDLDVQKVREVLRSRAGP